MTRTLAVIPARGGSKGVPRKNIRELAGKPLIGHMISHALAVPAITDVIVSTDDEEIAAVARAQGAQVPFLRPKELAEDHMPSWPTVRHALKEMESRTGQPYEYVVMLQATAPLCRPEDIAACLNRLNRNDCESVVTVVRVTTHHPFRMKRIVGDDILVNLIDQGFEDMRPRQSLPAVYQRSGAVYASRRNVILEQDTVVGMNARAVVVPAETGLEIDSLIDFELVRLVMAQHKELKGD
jgi:CMP-N,N'-diacetyllegionaminic acid synthase